MNDKERLLLHKKWTGLISGQELSQLETLLSSDPAFRQEAEALESIWAKATFLEPRFIPNEERAWARFKEQMHAPSAAPARPARLVPLRALLRVAAAVALLAATVFLFQSRPGSNFFAGHETLRTGAGEAVVAFVLPDSSVLWVNEKSAVSFPRKAKEGERKVRLSGEAFFEVKKNSLAPFIIETPNGEVRVLGTSFNVKAYPGSDAEEVYVSTGEVQFTARKNGLRKNLTRDQAAQLKKSTLQFTEPPARTAEEVLEWRENVLNFRKTPLREILKGLAAHYGVRFNVEKLKREIIECPYTVSFEGVPEQVAVEYLRRATGMQISPSGAHPKTYLLYGGSCDR